MSSIAVRRPAVAGQFYPQRSAELKRQISGFLENGVKKQDAIACILPHAGYIYSGKVAALTIAGLNIRNKVIMLGPNHNGLGPELSLMESGIWQTPLGEVHIDTRLAHKILDNYPQLKPDTSAHLYEHSLEVELPILQYFKEGFSIVPISIFSDDLNKLQGLGRAIAKAIAGLNESASVMLLASTDMTHYEPKPQAEKKDRAAIQRILELDEVALFKLKNELNISMCGYAAVIALLTAAKLLGAKKGELIKYQTSAEATTDDSSVVGYAGIAIY